MGQDQSRASTPNTRALNPYAQQSSSSHDRLPSAGGSHPDTPDHRAAPQTDRGKAALSATATNSIIGTDAGPLTDEIIVVHSQESQQQEPEIIALSKLGKFYPILKGAENGNWYLTSKDLEDIDERLDPADLYILNSRLQNYMAKCAESVGTQQDILTESAKRLDVIASHAASILANRQKQYTRLASSLSETKALLQAAQQMQQSASKLIDACAALNDLLPESERERDEFFASRQQRPPQAPSASPASPAPPESPSKPRLNVQVPPVSPSKFTGKDPKSPPRSPKSPKLHKSMSNSPLPSPSKSQMSALGLFPFDASSTPSTPFSRQASEPPPPSAQPNAQDELQEALSSDMDIPSTGSRRSSQIEQP